MKILALCFLLAACAAPETVFKPVTIDVPVAVVCQAAPVAMPDFATTHVTDHDDLFTKMRAALVELDQRKAYEAALKNRNQHCL